MIEGAARFDARFPGHGSGEATAKACGSQQPDMRPAFMLAHPKTSGTSVKRTWRLTAGCEGIRAGAVPESRCCFTQGVPLPGIDRKGLRDDAAEHPSEEHRMKRIHRIPICQPERSQWFKDRRLVKD